MIRLKNYAVHDLSQHESSFRRPVSAHNGAHWQHEALHSTSSYLKELFLSCNTFVLGATLHYATSSSLGLLSLA